jgi:hypothetical protein
MAKTGRKKKPKQIDTREDVTPERAAKGVFISAGMARRLVPMIDQLRASEVLNDREHKALGYYRDQASLAERSHTKSCIDFSPGGGRGPGVAIISAQRETHRMERDMGPLASLVRAIAVDDQSLKEWCQHRFGSNYPKSQIGIAVLELKYAAGGIISPE